MVTRAEKCSECGAPKAAGPCIVYRSTSQKEGGCNFCSRWVDARGSIEHEVTVVKGDHNGCLVVRFCDQCLAYVKVCTS